MAIGQVQPLAIELHVELHLKQLGGDDAQVSNKPRDRLLILPWTFSSSLLSLDEFAHKALEY
jgi:hypothetical protein